MVSTAIVCCLLVVASYTDIRWRKVYNWTTYSGILAALVLNAGVTFWPGEPNRVLGFVGMAECFQGLLGCGFLMLVCYVFFPGGVGGGDVKLIAMIGSFLGPYHGLEAMLWTFVLGGATALVVLTWQFGAWQLFLRGGQRVLAFVRVGRFAPWSDDERERLKTDLFLAPSALLSVVIVQFQVDRWF